MTYTESYTPNLLTYVAPAGQVSLVPVPTGLPAAVPSPEIPAES